MCSVFQMYLPSMPSLAGQAPEKRTLGEDTHARDLLRRNCNGVRKAGLAKAGSWAKGLFNRS